MPKFIVQHGSVKTDSTTFVCVGESLEISAKEAKEIDPDGSRLVPVEAWEELKKAEAAKKRAADIQKSPPKSAVPVK